MGVTIAYAADTSLFKSKGSIFLGRTYTKRVAEKKMVATVRWEDHVERAFFLLWVLGMHRIVMKISK